MTLRLPQYQFRLYPADPRSSTLIARLSDALQTILLIAAIYAAVGNLIGYLRASEPDSAIPLVTWLAIITAFVVYQRALGRMITHAKWRTLDDIQSKVERLQTMQDIPDEKALAQMNKLMDYHDRIEATPNSLFNLREGIKLVNALLLPLAAFVLGNIDQVLAWFRP